VYKEGRATPPAPPEGGGALLILHLLAFPFLKQSTIYIVHPIAFHSPKLKD